MGSGGKVKIGEGRRVGQGVGRRAKGVVEVMKGSHCERHVASKQKGEDGSAAIL